MNKRDVFRIGFWFGKGFAKRYRRSPLFYGGFIEGWHSPIPNKSHKRKIKMSPKPDGPKEEIGSKD